MDLGDLGVARPKYYDTFGWFGTKVRTNPNYSELELIDFLDAAKDVEEDDPSSLTIIKKTLKAAVHPDDFELFWRLAKENGQTSEDLMKAYQKIIEGISSRSFGKSTDSLDGRTSTALSSVDDSARRVISLESRRPDTQASVFRANLEKQAISH